MRSFEGKKVLIFGLGLNQGGVGSAKFFIKAGADIRITDLKNAEVLQPSLEQLKEFKNISYTLEKHTYEDIDWADLIIKNPAVKLGNPYITYALEHGKQVETDMGVFLQYVKPRQIIGITGTKGKSTTASLIYKVLKTTGRDIVFAGNIGISVLDTIPFIKQNTLVVLEISSFQLESFEKHQVSPKWAVITNISPDHLNYYTSMKDYIAAKKIIGKYQTKDNFLFIKKDDQLVDTEDFLNGFKATIIRFSKNDLPKDFKSTLMGEHNKENIAAALSVGMTVSSPKLLRFLRSKKGKSSTLRSLRLEEVLQASDIIISDRERSRSLLKTLADFKGIPFRMELIKEWNGVKIYNDTAATSPESGIKAIKTFPGCILICGGMNKGMNYTKYAEEVRQNVKKVFFLEGDSTESVILSLRGAKPRQRRAKRRGNLKIYGSYNNLEQLLEDVKKEVEPNDIVLFSPAATSFNLFQNEFDRGRRFNEAVNKIFK